MQNDSSDTPTSEATPRRMYAAGLHARMWEYARGSAHTAEETEAGPSLLVQAYAEGRADGDDDSDEPRPSGPALDDARGAVEANDDE